MTANKTIRLEPKLQFSSRSALNMQPANWKQIKTALADAMELSSESREQFVSSLDPDIGAQVRRYLRVVTDARDFITNPAWIDRGLIDQNTYPAQIDDFRILHPIGSGGMGTVYLAEHADDGFKQLVALKLIKRGMDTSAVLKRFLMERRILAELDHPNIARMLDGGSTADGLPYFVMEYVEGDEIRKYANANNLGLEQRLELFRTVCSAVSSAHQRLVIHRDIKPTNILVTKDGEPKLLDFGIAKLISPDWNSEEATLTQFRVLTPGYASPEQMDGRAVSTATDVYSLGVVLYELLTGSRPFSFRDKDGRASGDKALTAEPPKPSLIACETSQPNHRTKQQRLVRKTLFRPAQVTVAAIEPSRLRGDLDNIILKAIRYEPERRYQSVQEFSADIRRWLDGLPVSATSDSRMYRFRKFCKRHRTPVLASAAAAVLLIAAFGVTGWQYSVARDQQAKAEARFQSIRLVAKSLLNETSKELENLPQSAEIQDAVVGRAIALLNSLAVDENTDPEFLDEVADAYEQLAHIRNWKFRKTSEAIADYRKALALRERVIHYAPENFAAREKLTSTLSGLSEVYDLVGDIEETGRLRSRIVENQRSLLLIDPRNPKRMYALAAGLDDLAARVEASSPEQGAAYRSESLTIVTDALDHLPAGTLSAADTELYVSLKMLQGFLLDKLERDDEALAIFHEGLETAKSAYLADDSRLYLFNHAARLSRMMADVHIARNDWAKALENYEFSLNWIKDHRDNRKLAARTLRSGEAIYTVRTGRALHKVGRKTEATARISEGLKLHFDYAADYANDASILIYSPEILSTASAYFAESERTEPGREMWQKFARKVLVFLERNPNDAQMSGLLAFARESEGDLIAVYSAQSDSIWQHNQAALTAAITVYSAALEIQQRMTAKHSVAAAGRLKHKIALCQSSIPNLSGSD